MNKRQTLNMHYLEGGRGDQQYTYPLCRIEPCYLLILPFLFIFAASEMCIYTNDNFTIESLAVEEKEKSEDEKRARLFVCVFLLPKGSGGRRSHPPTC